MLAKKFLEILLPFCLFQSHKIQFQNSYSETTRHTAFHERYSVSYLNWFTNHASFSQRSII